MLCYVMVSYVMVSHVSEFSYHPLFHHSPLHVMYHEKHYITKTCAERDERSESREARISQNMVSPKHYIAKTCAERDERSESREALISQKHGITKTSYHKNMRGARRANLVTTPCFTTAPFMSCITKNIISQKHAPSETSEASLARRLYHKNMVSQKLNITKPFYHIQINFWGLRLGIIFKANP